MYVYSNMYPLSPSPLPAAENGASVARRGARRQLREGGAGGAPHELQLRRGQLPAGRRGVLFDLHGPAVPPAGVRAVRREVSYGEGAVASTLFPLYFLCVIFFSFSV